MKNVLITGAGGNLGIETVKFFLSKGNTVIAIVSPGKTIEGINSPNLHVYSADLTNEDAVSSLVQSVISEFTHIHSALLLAGGFAAGTLQETDHELLHNMLRLNFETAVNVVKPLQTHMLEKNWGRIILIGARPAIEPSRAKKMIAYALSKSMLLKLADFLNSDFQSGNLKCFVLIPDTIDTPDNRKWMPDADYSKWIKPETIADLMWRLSQEELPTEETVIKLYPQ